MDFISYRGNINGKDPEREGKKDFIEEALRLGFHVAVKLEDVFRKGTEKEDAIWIAERADLLWIVLEKTDFDDFNRLVKDFQLCAFPLKFIDDGENANWKAVFSTDSLKGNMRRVCIWLKDFVNLPNYECAVITKPEEGGYELEDIASAYGVCSDSIMGFRREFNKRYTEELVNRHRRCSCGGSHE